MKFFNLLSTFENIIKEVTLKISILALSKAPLIMVISKALAILSGMILSNSTMCPGLLMNINIYVYIFVFLQLKFKFTFLADQLNANG